MPLHTCSSLLGQIDTRELPINDQKYFVGSVLAHLLMDLVILALPAPYIKKLQISFYQKFCVLAMFLLGGL